MEVNFRLIRKFVIGIITQKANAACVRSGGEYQVAGLAPDILF
jgi:hypothetical protein